MTRERRAAALGPALVLTTLVVSSVSALGAPLILTVARHFHTSTTTAQWSLTAALLSGAVSAPVMGRLGDGPHRRATLVGGLAVVTLGGVVAALAPALGVLVAGRALQGVGLGLVPLAIATARDELPPERVAPMVALLSVSSAAGVGVGYPISGVFADAAGLAGAFWFGTAVSGVALLWTALVMPSSRPGGADGPLDWAGALLLAAALVCLLVAVAQGPSWGWLSTRIVTLLGGSAVLLVVWARQQHRAQTPLVELRLLRHRAVLAGDTSATVLGVALYASLTAVTEFVQLPRSGGFGFSASVVVAGLTLVPLSVAMLLAARSLPGLARRLGPRAVLPSGCLMVSAATVFFALCHDALWEAFVMMALLGLGFGATYAAIPGLIVRSVPQRETGSAMGFYQVVRYVGFALGSALAASILAGHTSATGAPTVAGYTTVLWVGGAICLVAAGLAWALSGAER